MNISISLTPELIDLVEAKVQSGRYASTSEVVQEALWLLEQKDRLDANNLKIEDLRQAWRDGIESGGSAPLDFAALRETAMRELVGHRKG